MSRSQVNALSSSCSHEVLHQNDIVPAPETVAESHVFVRFPIAPLRADASPTLALSSSIGSHGTASSTAIATPSPASTASSSVNNCFVMVTVV